MTAAQDQAPEQDVVDDEQAEDEHIQKLITSWPKMTAEQADRLSRLFKYGPPPTAEDPPDTGNAA